MSDFQENGTRFDSKIKKRKQNRILNSLIVVVIVLIAAVGWNIFFSGSEEAGESGQDRTEQTASSGAGDGEDPQDENIVVSDPEDEQSQEGQTDASTGEEENRSKKNDQEDKQKQSDKNKTDEKIKQGPWEPVGTQQEQFNPGYKKGSVNWNEMTKAALVPTGFSESEITLWRLEGDGGPKKAVGKYSLKGNPGKLYVVHIQWVDGEGWKPVDVEIKNNPYS